VAFCYFEETVMGAASEVGLGESRAAKIFREIVESGRPLTYVRSPGEQRVGGVLRGVSQRLFPTGPAPVWTWSLT
jgi:hypothetical protein